MRKRNILLLTAIVMLCQFASSQEVSYYDHTLKFQQKPAYPQYTGYTTFDMAAITSMDEREVNMNLPYQIKLGNLKQVTTSSDFHVITVLRRLKGKFTSDASMTANIFIESYVHDKYGNLVSGFYTDKEDRIINFDKALSKDERNNEDIVRQKVVEKMTESLLSEFVDAFNGAKMDIKYELAGLSEVKKKPELADFSKTVKDIDPVPAMDELLKALTPHVAYWEKMSEYAGEGDINEVKRAAYQNLSVYHIIKGETEKAAGYIEKYKAIDKVHKMMMGLLKVKHSENCEQMLAKMYPEAAAEIDETAPLMSLQQVKDDFKYVTVKGTVTVDAKKIGGTYDGLIQISKLINVSGGGGIASLDAENADVIITLKDAGGNEKTIKTELSKITSLKDDKGVEYAVKKFGSVVGGAYYSLLKPTYNSDKITVYRTLVPAGNNDYVIKKSGDEKGVKSSLVNARKQLVEYLSDCSSLTEKLKNGTIDKKEKVEKIAEMYSNCGSTGSN